MISTVERRTQAEVRLVARFEPEGPPEVPAEAIELVMRDIRRFAQAASLSAPFGRRKHTAPGSSPPHGAGLPEWAQEVPSGQYSQVVSAVPAVMRVTVGSLEVAVELTVLFATGLGALARCLYLVERYWNIRLRLRLEAESLRREIDEVAHRERHPGGRVTEYLASVDKTVGGADDRRETAELLQAVDGVLERGSTDADDETRDG